MDEGALLIVDVHSLSVFGCQSTTNWLTPLRRRSACHDCYAILTFLDSSMVEHSAVNRRVVGSSPTRGVFVERRGPRQWEDSLRHGDAAEGGVVYRWVNKLNQAPWSSG